jgi:hypothetical protein
MDFGVAPVRPPLYFALTNALRGEGSERKKPEDIRTFILQISEYKDEYTKLWQQFIKESPSDTAAQFMGDMLVSA